MPAISAGVGGGGVQGPGTLATLTGVIIWGPRDCTDNTARRIVVAAAGDTAFRLDHQFSPDLGVTWYPRKQTASSTITIGTGESAAGYVAAAQIDEYIGFNERIQLYNPSGGTINVTYEVREFDAGA